MIFDNQGIIVYDVSRWQADLENKRYIDFNKLKKNGRANAVIIKCGQRDYPDPTFKINWENSKNAGIPRSSYWFLDYRNTGKNQAKLYWDYIKNDVGEGMYFCDFEKGSDNKWDTLFNFIKEFQQLSGLPNHKIGVYTNYYYWTEHQPKTESSLNWFAQYPLWIAWYSKEPKDVKIPKNWKDCILWQDGTPSINKEEFGVWSNEIDHNIFNGNMEKFNYHFNNKASEPQIPSENKSITISNIELKGKITLSDGTVIDNVELDFKGGNN